MSCIPQQMFSRPAARKQAGLATILILVLVGLLLSTVVLGSMNYIRAAQAQQMSVHSVTQAQMKGWTGVEIVRQYLAGLSSTDLATLANGASTTAPKSLTFTGITGLLAQVVGSDNAAAPTQITVDITGNTSINTPAESKSTIRVVYQISPGSSTTQQNWRTPKSAIVMNGNVNYTGGGFQILSGNVNLDDPNNPQDMSDFAIGGNLSVSSGTQIVASGCTKGTITLSGGGIAANSRLYSEQDFIISQMSAPSNVTLWGRSINLQQDGGSYTALLAGALAVNVFDNSTGTQVATANVGGTRLSQTSTIVLPSIATTDSSTGVTTNPASVVVTMTDGTNYLLDMTKITVDSATGVVTVASGATDKLNSNTNSSSSDMALPNSLLMRYTGVYGGSLSTLSLTSAKTWGGSVTINNAGVGTHTNLWAFGDVSMYPTSVTTLRGNGNLTGNGGNSATISDGRIRGSYSGSPAKPSGLTVAATDVNVGLYGVPYCETRVQPIAVKSMQGAANYVFYFYGSSNAPANAGTVTGASTDDPMLYIQNVQLKNSSGVLVNVAPGPYSLKTEPTLKDTNGNSLGGLKTYMACSWGNKYCGYDATKANGWTLSGTTQFPTGVVWMEGAVDLNGGPTAGYLGTGFVGTGNVTLESNTSSITAPNFTTAANTCGGTLVPSNLCSKQSDGSWAFTTWCTTTVSSGQSCPSANTITGQAIGNMAIVTEGSLSAAGWAVNGNVVLGQSISTSGSSVVITGSLTVGANKKSDTTISQGGIKVVLSGVTSSQGYIQDGSTTTVPSTSTTGTAKMLWSRYL